MFYNASDMADANHRYSANNTEGLEQDVNDASIRVSYLELVRYISLVVNLQQESEALSALLDDVSGHLIFIVVLT